MSLSLEESEAVSQLAGYLYDFLPGNPHPLADQRISFQGIAHDLGIEGFWRGGSKEPAIAALLESVLEHKREQFCRLIVEVVRRGIRYRHSKGRPLTREDVKGLNDLVSRVGFKIPELWHPNFLDRLPSTDTRKKGGTPSTPRSAAAVSQEQLANLNRCLLDLIHCEPHKRGYELERFLKDLFMAFGRAPRDGFRLTGEQIDGSFQLGDDTYLVEAKWHSSPMSLQPLLAFDGKVTGKATWSRGVYVSYSGFSDEAIEAFGRGRPASFIGFEARDLCCILEGRTTLSEAIRLKERFTAETGGFMGDLDVILREKGR